MYMEKARSDRKRLVLKIGSNTLTRETNAISRGKIEDIARQIAVLRDTYEFVIVSSGAIATARQFVHLNAMGTEITEKQALASIGQPHLMRIFQESFQELGVFTAQCLLSYSDFERKESRDNIRNTINVLTAHDYVPIINENDTVATDEIKFGDNDKLGALTAVLLNADCYMIATNTNGIYAKDSIADKSYRTIPSIDDINLMTKEIHTGISSHGTGGMASKAEAARITQNAGIETWIVNGLEDQFIQGTLSHKHTFTKIIPVYSGSKKI